MRLGINYKFSESVMIDSEIEKDISQKFIFKTGIEYHISKPIYLRVGIATNSFLSTFGFGIEFNKLNLDFSSSFHSLLGYIPQLSITYGF